MKSPLLWDITQGIVAISYRRFGIKVPYIAPRPALKFYRSIPTYPKKSGTYFTGWTNTAL